MSLRGGQQLIGKMNLIYMALTYSSYYHNQTLHDAFYMLQDAFYLIENLSIDEALQISIILREIIMLEQSALDIEACKKLNDYMHQLQL